jgi:acetyl esterase/lipase
MLVLLTSLALAIVAPAAARPADGPPAPRVMRGIEYARVGEHALQLDLYLPPAKAGAQPPLVVWVHGGAWRSGSRAEMPLGSLVQRGYAIASVDYRLTPVAPFPAQVHDLKAAIRFLRARARSFGLDVRHIAVAGSSAGGHLAALVGVTNGDRALEGRVGDRLRTSSRVHAIVSLYGASNLQSILSQSTPHGLSVRVPALQLLLGGQPDDQPALARQASPVAHVDARDPPLLLIHGDADPQMPPEQSHELAARYRAVGAAVELAIVPGGKHGGDVFYDEDRLALIERFLARHLRR